MKRREWLGRAGQALAWGVSAGLLEGLGTAAGRLRAAPAPPRLQGTVSWVVPFSAGGGWDTYARVLANIWDEELLPEANVVVVNYAGAAGIEGITALYRAAPDGRTLGSLPTNTAYVNQMLHSRLVRYDARRFTFLGSMSEEYYVVFVSAKSPYRSIQELRQAAMLRTGAVGRGSSSYLAAVVAMEALGIRATLIPSGTGSREVALAAARGDLDFVVYNFSDVKPFVDSGDLIPVLFLGPGESRPPELASVPTAGDIGVPEAGLVVEWRVIAGPPDLPADLASYLEESLWQAMQHPRFRRWSQESGRSIRPRRASDIRQLVMASFALLDKTVPALVQKGLL